jgi:hypothetical protein
VEFELRSMERRVYSGAASAEWVSLDTKKGIFFQRGNCLLKRLRQSICVSDCGLQEYFNLLVSDPKAISNGRNRINPSF